MKLTKKHLEDLVVFNRNQKRIGEPKLSPEEYLIYIYGKIKLKPNKNRLKSSSLPSWAVDHSNIPSITSDHIALKKQDGYKKDISKRYPVAPPANKMGAQVLLLSEVVNAGKKV